MAHVLIWGNAYCQIVRDGRGFPIGLYPLLPDRVSVERNERGLIVYTYRSESGQEIRLHPEVDVFNIWEAEKDNTINLYIHFPFCKYKCGFCNLYSMACSDMKVQDNYMDAVVKQMENYRSIIEPRTINTIYVGGGTPMLLSKENFSKIIDALNYVAPSWSSTIKEFSMEASPDSIVKASQTGQLNHLIENGLDRVNIGIQSFKQNDINVMGRDYGENINVQAVNILKEYGIRNISTDLIAGFDMQSFNDWVFSVKQLIELYPHTISIYSLRVRPDSEFGKNEEAVKNPPSSYYEWYEAAREIILETGDYHQETNVRFTRLNSGGYLQQEYHFGSYPILGIGCGARSYNSITDYIVGGGYPADISQIENYIEGVYNNDLKIEKAFIMTDIERIRKMLVLNLYAFDLNEVHSKYGNQYDHIFLDTLESLVEHGIVKKEGSVYSYTHEGIKYRDIISWAFFSEDVKLLDGDFYSNVRSK